MVPWYVLWIRTLIRITAVLKKLRGAIGVGRNNCNESDKCLHGGHRSGSEESVVCSEFERGCGGGFHSIGGVLEDEQLFAKRTKRRNGFWGKGNSMANILEVWHNLAPWEHC